MVSAKSLPFRGGGRGGFVCTGSSIQGRVVIMNFWKKFLFNLALYIIGLTIVYFIAPELWTGLTTFFFSIFIILAALPKRR
jgi:hypothetical protein